MSLRRLVAVFLLWISASAGDDDERSFEIVNNAGFTIEMYWVKPETREAILVSTPEFGLPDDAQTPFYSFVGHEFEIREMPATETGECGNENDVCRSTTFVVSEDQSECTLLVSPYDIS